MQSEYSLSAPLDAKPDIEKIRRSLTPLQLGERPTNDEAIDRFLSYYRLKVPGSAYQLGVLDVSNVPIAVHVWQPTRPRGTVLAVHGYLDHVGTLRHLIHHLVNSGYTVVAYDQPGHGLSGGAEATIEDFAQYADVLAAVWQELASKSTGPHFLVAHSAGASATMEFLLQSKTPRIEQVIFLAPLVRSRGWGFTKIGLGLRWAIKRVPRAFRDNSSDADYLDFVKHHDPLQSRKIPLQWTHAMHRWADEFVDAPTSGHPISLIQGTGDKIVAWQYSVRLIEEKFPDSTTYLIEGARHQLLNERIELRQLVLDRISSILEQPNSE